MNGCLHSIDLNNILEGFVRNYHTLNLSIMDKKNKYYIREMEYFARLGEMFGYITVYDDKGLDVRYTSKNPMDLAWYQKDSATGSLKLVLHIETGKLFSTPQNELVYKIISKGVFSNRPPNVLAIIHSEQESTAKDFISTLYKNYTLHNNFLILCKIYNYEKNYFKKILCWQLSSGKISSPRTIITDIRVNGIVSLYFKDDAGYDSGLTNTDV